MTSTILLKLACSCLILDENPELAVSIKEKFASGNIDLNRFVFLCSEHLVLPAVYSKLKNAGISEYIPDDLNSHLNDIYRLNVKRNKEILLQTDEISTKLAVANIEPIYLKGTANLLDNLYSDAGNRLIGDVDFLVREEDYKKTVSLLLKLGYKPTKKMYYDVNIATHYLPLFRDDAPAAVEVHRLPVNLPYSKQFNTELLFANKKPVQGRINCYVSSNEHKLIHTFIHSQLSNKGYSYKITGLRDVYDTRLLMKKVNLESVLSHIEEKKKATIFFEYVSHLFSADSEKNSSSQKTNKKSFSGYLWFLKHPRWHRTFFIVLKIYELIFIEYLGTLLVALFSKSTRKYLWARIKDPDWYRMHYNDLKMTFFK